MTKDKNEHTAVARSNSMPISTKISFEICNFIRGKEVKKAQLHLKSVIDHKMAVPYIRYNKDTPHRPGAMASGRYPEKAAGFFIKLLNSLIANAEDKGLNAADLIITKATANKGANRYHTGRIRGIKMKVTHLEIEAKEGSDKK
jgi:ribosomal protein uL22